MVSLLFLTIQISDQKMLKLIKSERVSHMNKNHKLQSIIQTKAGKLVFLFLIWAAVGFILGLVMGRIIWMIQLL